jgi:hypothetical protein
LPGLSNMIKKHLPTLIAVALAGGMSVASADVTVFGHIDTSVDFADQDGGADTTNLNCTTCSFGFKGSEDLGNGLKAMFKIDFQYDTTERNGSSPTEVNAITDRDQWLGLGGVFGQLRVGTISTVYKSHGAMLDPIYRTAQQQRDRGLQSDLHDMIHRPGMGSVLVRTTPCRRKPLQPATQTAPGVLVVSGRVAPFLSSQTTLPAMRVVMIRPGRWVVSTIWVCSPFLRSTSGMTA